MRTDLSRCALIAALCFASAAARAAAPAPKLAAGTYVMNGGSGTLTLGKPAPRQSFELETVGANGHTCTLSGDVVDGTATLSEDEGEACVVQFRLEPDGIEVATSTPEPCRNYCGMRAWFEGSYMKPPEGCDAAKVLAERNRFKKLFDRKAFAEAKAVLSPLLSRCEPVLDRFTLPWIRNDLALTLHKLGDDAGCLQVLEPLREWAQQDDESISVEPVFSADLLKIAKATRHNLKVCQPKKP